jgi:hypothetical protein
MLILWSQSAGDCQHHLTVVQASSGINHKHAAVEAIALCTLPSLKPPVQKPITYASTSLNIVL